MINRAEITWLDSLYSNAKRVYAKASMPSHDHTHHQRVWKLSKILLLEISRINPHVDQDLVDGVIVAAFFHDLGMVHSMKEDHGALGAELCKTWFRENALAVPDRYEEVLNAIELHDIKERGSYPKITADERPGILSLLSMADDLEAFGIIGIYRYAEIYLMRHIPLSHLGDRILSNARSRYQSLQESCGACGKVMEICQMDYSILKDFYQSYNLQLKQGISPDTVFVGHLGVINYIRTRGMEEQIGPEHFSNLLESDDAIVNTYFRTLKNELEQARN